MSRKARVTHEAYHFHFQQDTSETSSSSYSSEHSPTTTPAEPSHPSKPFYAFCAQVRPAVKKMFDVSVKKMFDVSENEVRRLASDMWQKSPQIREAFLNLLSRRTVPEPCKGLLLLHSLLETQA